MRLKQCLREKWIFLTWSCCTTIVWFGNITNFGLANKLLTPGLPDFSWYNIPKWQTIIQNAHKIYPTTFIYIYQIAIKIPNVHYIY
jgi:hypothetical protein